MTNNLKEKKQRHRPIVHRVGGPSGIHHGLTYLYLFLLFQLLPYAAAQNQTPPVGFYDYGNGFSASFSPAMAIVFVVVISFFILLAFFTIYVRQCTGRDGGSVRANFHFLGAGTSRRPNRGLDPAVIENFPTFQYSVVKGLKLGKGALECAVCLNEFEDEETIRLLPKCDHVFHPECIDVWLSNRTTCPVCRADLVLEPGEIPATVVPVLDLEAGESEEEIRESETVDGEVISEVEPARDVAVTAPEVINPIQAPMQNRPTRSKSTRPRYAERFPRSNSTGHSLVQTGEDMERFTLRLPDEVRKQIMNMRLTRTRSMVVFQRAGSSRRGNRVTGEGSSRGGRILRVDTGEKREGWVFSMMPPFFVRASSARSPKMTAELDSTVSPARLSPLPSKTFRSPLRASTKSNGTGQSSTRPPV